MFSAVTRSSVAIAIIFLMTACARGVPSPSGSPSVTPTAVASAFPITTYAKTIATTPAAPVPTTSTTPTLQNITLTSAVTSLSEAGHGVDQLAMDDTYIYWTADGGGDIFRYPIHPSGNAPRELFALTQFTQGKIYMSPSDNLIRSGNWLVFADNQITERRWALRAVNVVNGTNRKIAEGIDPQGMPWFSSDGIWVAWAMDEIQATQSPQTGLWAYNLDTGQTTQLNHSASLQNSWYEMRISDGRLAAERSAPGGSELYLFDLASGDGRRITPDPSGSTHGLTFDGEWMAWISGSANVGPTVLYNLKTDIYEIVPNSAENNSGTFPLLAGHWLTWDFSPDQPLLVYDLDTGQFLTAAEPQPGDEFTDVAIHGNEIVWCRLRAYHPTPPATEWSYDSTIEWRVLPV